MKRFIVMLLLLIVSGCQMLTGYEENRPFELNATNSVIFVEADVVASRESSSRQDGKQTNKPDIPIDVVNPMKLVTDKVRAGKDLLEIMNPSASEPPVIVLPINPEPLGEDVTLDPLSTSSCKPYTRTTGNPKSACRIPTNFAKHDYPVTFIFNNNCGQFTIPTATSDYLPKGKEHYVYLKWEKGSPVVFTKAKCVASSVSAYRGYNGTH